MIAQEKIQEVTDRLVETYHPLAIYLFGSYAWGEPNEDSDIDFMVVVGDDVELTWSSFKKGKWAIRDMRITNDILVENRSVFKKRAAHPANLEHQIAQKGIKLYAKTRGMVIQSGT
jgi:uncharacterized protein